jgi:3D (Asp-Asp-Asp) domain-containing protein
MFAHAIIWGITALITLYPTSAGVKADIEPATGPVVEVQEVRNVWVTAYSSTPEETDDTPFTTASGQTVRDGIVATNLYPFGTKVQIPSLFGDKIFEVQDRMHARKTNGVDVWMDGKPKALAFGAHKAEVHILK